VPSRKTENSLLQVNAMI